MQYALCIQFIIYMQNYEKILNFCCETLRLKFLLEKNKQIIANNLMSTMFIKKYYYIKEYYKSMVLF